MNYSSAELKTLLPESKYFPSITQLAQTEISAENYRDKYEYNEERVLRTLSWLCAAENAEDINVRLTSILIAFNALYAHPLVKNNSPDPNPPSTSSKKSRKQTDKNMINSFVSTLVEHDGAGILLDFLTKEGRSELTAIMCHRYLFMLYWGDYMVLQPPSQQSEWEEKFHQQKKDVEKLLGRNQVKEPLQCVLKRIYVLRNQMLHGAAGYGDYYNRSQVNLGAKFMLPLVGRMLYIVITTPIKWGEVPYPPQDKPDALTSLPKRMKEK